MRETSSFPLFLYYISLSVSFFSPLFFFHFFSIRYFRFILSYYAFLNEGTLSLHRSTRGIFHPSRRFSFICKNEFILKLEKKCHSYHYLTQLMTSSSSNSNRNNNNNLKRARTPWYACTHFSFLSTRIDRYSCIMCTVIKGCNFFPPFLLGSSTFDAQTKAAKIRAGMLAHCARCTVLISSCRIKLKFNGFSNCHGKRVICEGEGARIYGRLASLEKIEINKSRRVNGLLIKEATFWRFSPRRAFVVR